MMNLTLSLSFFFFGKESSLNEKEKVWYSWRYKVFVSLMMMMSFSLFCFLNESLVCFTHNFSFTKQKKASLSLSLSLYYSSTLYSSLFFSHLHCLISFNQSKQNKTKKTTLGLLFSSKSSWLHTQQQHTNSVVVMCGVIFICESERWSISVKFFHFSFPSTITSIHKRL